MAETQKVEKVNLDDDIFASTGYWEPMAFIKRGGRAVVGLEDDEYPYSEEMAKKLSDVGINLVVWHYYKGLGIKTEEEEMQKTAKFFKHCEKYGLTKGVYINSGSIFADTFIAENPDFADKIAIDQFGSKHQYSEFYRNYYRWRPCSSNKEFGEYFGRASVKAIQEAGADFIMFDNSGQMSCYCEKCRKGFPQYLLEKFPAEPQAGKISFKERFGYDFRGSFELPRGTSRMPIDNMPGAHEPGFYEWVRYRQQLYEGTLKTACDVIRQASGKAKIGWNIALDYGEFPGLVWGIDPESSYRCGTNYFFSEDSNFAGIEDGRLITHIRTFKYGRAMNNRVMFHNLPEKGGNEIKWLNYAEAAVFNDGCLGRVNWATDPDDGRLDFLKKSLKFLRKHKDVYLHSKCMSRVALYRCAESEVANWADERISMLAIEQVLIKNSIQYDQIINDRFDDITNYDMLICTNTITVPDVIVRKIADFIRGGGKLFCTESSLSVDEYNRRRSFRPDMGLAGERDSSLGRVSGRADVSEILGYLGLEDKYAENIFYLPKIDYAKPFAWSPCSAYLPIIGKEYFAEPLNKDEVLALLREALGENNVKVAGPENVITGYFECADGSKVIHVLDYEAGRELGGLKLRFKLAGEKSKQAKFVTLDLTAEVKLEHNGDYATCILPTFKTYGFLKI